ncbi:class I SAM-dependent RNA methyltransferase [Thalassobaculum salexigens]|uniref:class I SAM-dependent RNA methyltransferase n=1 Tax=Thalassobaculum salexigens TaxID=455360 RepID=UPI0004013176|nr:class I SAM-dependent RNA methyltransferase [Thalassobaculum salexigens]
MPPRRRRSKPTPIKKGRIPANAGPVDVEIETVGGRGDGVGTATVKIGYDERARLVFVPFTLPGERVRARPVADRGEGVAAEPVELLSTADDRVDPACPHFMTCGGCALQHWRDESYQDWKVGQIRQHLSRVGIEGFPMAPLVTAEPGTRRRADFAVRRLSDRTVLGFHERGGSKIVPLDTCPVLTAPIQALLHPVSDQMHRVLQPGEGADVIVNHLHSGLDMLVVLPRSPNLQEREAWAKFAETEGLARLSMRVAGDSDPMPEPLSGRGAATIRLGGVDVTPPPGAFLQATASGETAIREAVAQAARKAKRRLDLFAGIGTLSLPLAADGPVLAIDGDTLAIRALRAAADAAGLGTARLKTETRELFKLPLEGDELDGFDVVVFDPPRAGAKAQAAALAASGIPTIVAVSCNPATFARDAAALVEGGYTLERLVPIDQFLWSPHIELVAVFRR